MAHLVGLLTFGYLCSILALSVTSVPLLNVNEPIDVSNSVITFSTLLAKSTRILEFYSYYCITNKHWKNIMQISSFHPEHVNSWYPVIANLNNEQIFVIYVFSPNMFFNHDKVLCLIHQLHSPKMMEIYHRYLEMLLYMCSTAVALLTALQTDSARTWSQENNSI